MYTIGEHLTITRRKLPHWERGGSVYFITFRSQLGVLPANALRVLRDTIYRHHGQLYLLHIAVLMPDHAHLIIQPCQIKNDQWHSLREIMQMIKGGSSILINQVLNRKGKVWQKESYDRVIRDEEEYHATFTYTLNNPVRAGLVERFEDHEFVLWPPNEMRGTP